MSFGERKEELRAKFSKAAREIPDDVVRDWSGEEKLCQEITQAMRALDAAGATGILAEKEE